MGAPRLAYDFLGPVELEPAPFNVMAVGPDAAQQFSNLFMGSDSGRELTCENVRVPKNQVIMSILETLDHAKVNITQGSTPDVLVLKPRDDLTLDQMHECVGEWVQNYDPNKVRLVRPRPQVVIGLLQQNEKKYLVMSCASWVEKWCEYEALVRPFTIEGYSTPTQEIGELIDAQQCLVMELIRS